MDVAGTFASDSLQCILQLALLGAGIAKLADFLVADSVRSGQLVRLLADQHISKRARRSLRYSPRAPRRSLRCAYSSTS